MIFNDAVSRVVDEVRPYTMVSDSSLAMTMALVVDTIHNDRTGDIVECGTWRGGSSFAMLLIQRYLFGRIIKPVWMFDSFEGLPLADDRDGLLALEYQADPSNPFYFDNCTASQADLLQAIQKFGFDQRDVSVVKGWFEDTVPLHKSALEGTGIAVLRVDCDWYEPVRYTLESLTPYVSDEGFIILDDYFAWDGCARATHDFLSANSHSWRIRSMENFHAAWMVKREHRKDTL